METLTNLKITKDTISFQPFLRSRRGGKISFFAAIAVSIVVYFAHWKEQTTYTLYILAIVLALYAAYDFFIESKVIIEFNKTKKAVYKKLPGIFSRKLIALNDIDSIVPIYNNGCPQYCITHKENLFGKNYGISEFFNGTKEGVEAQEYFENNVLPLLLKFINS
jgi:hypothetical protein